LHTLIGLSCAALLLAASAPAARADDVLVFAAASATGAVEAVVAAFRALPATAPDTRVRASFASSGTLARQIAAGAPAHLFLSANERWMDWLAGEQKIAGDTRRNLMRNALVLVAPQTSRTRLELAQGLDLAAALGNGRLALPDPDHVPAGIYAKQALERLGAWQAVANRAARAQDVRAALVLVERGEAPLGIVYATDAKASDRVRVVDTFPRASHAPIVYPAALIQGRATAEARALLDFMASDEARAIFARFGFLTD